MALSRELNRHLTDDDNQPLPKRLKLAENAFTSLDLLLSRKEDVILNWLCEISNETNDIVAWQTLKRCLEFQHIQLNAATIKAPVKSSLVQAILNGLKVNGELELTCTIIRCCQSILFNREMQRYFVYRPTLIVDLLEQLLSLNLTQTLINSDNNIEILAELRECIVDSLNVLIECHRRSTNKIELNNDVIERIIYKLCIFNEKIANDKVTSIVTKCIQKFIFDKSIEINVFGDKNWGQELFAALFKHKENNFNNDDTIIVICHIFRAAMQLYKSSTSKIDMIYRNILNSAQNLTMKIKICNNIFRNINDITLDIQNEIDKITLAAYYHGIIDEILSLDSLDDDAYNCLDGIANFNPLIIESKLQDIFKKILLAKKSTDIIKSSYTNFMSDILNACIRLRRENKLVPWILIALDDSLCKNKTHQVNTDNILPVDFTNKFTASINNMTNALSTEVLMSFIYHLDASSSQSPESDTLSTMLDVINQLIVAFLNGIHIFDYTTPPATQRKFIDGLVKLGKVLEKLVKLISPINKYQIVAISVLKIINCWQKIIAFMKNYAHESITEENNISILKIINCIHRRLDKIESNSTINDNLDQLLSCCKLEKNRIYGNVEFDICDKIENNWTIIIDNYPYIIENFNNSQLSCLACVILNNVHDETTDVLKIERIKSRNVQQNKKLIMAIMFEIFNRISSKIKNSSNTTSNLLIAITNKQSLEEERSGKILKVCKKLLLEPQWTQNKFSISIVQYLKILMTLPLIHLNIKLKTIIFLVIFSMKKEWESSPDVIDLCCQILTNISENSNIDILQYINLQCYIEELSEHSAMNKILEYSLRNIANYDLLTAFIKSNEIIQDCPALILMESIGNIKSKLKPDEKIAVRKIEKKLYKKMLKPANSESKNLYQIRILKITFKNALVSKKVDETMLEQLQTTLHDIFDMNDNEDDHPKLVHNFQHHNAIMNEGLQIVRLIFQYHDKKLLNANIVKRTWSLILTKPSYDIIPDLFGVTTPKILKKVLKLLQIQTINAHKEQNEIVFENCMNIWNCISRVATSSNQIRQLHLQQLMQYFGTATLSNNDCLNVLRLCTIIINTKHVHISEKIVDLILFISEYCLTNLKTTSTFICDQVLILCLGFLTYRVNIITDRLPMILSLYRKVIRFIIDKSKCNNNSSNEHQLQGLALNTNKVAIAFVKLKKDMSKVSPYVIADIVEMYSEGVIPSHVKGPLDECISIFLSNCDHHAIPLLFRALPPATQQIFKTLYDNYTKFYKFTGKI